MPARPALEQSANAISQVDALFVINQDCPLGAVASRCERRGYRSILVLVTHHPFPPETASIQALAPEVRIVRFGDLVGDEEAEACDERASRDCRRRLGKGERRSYSAHFMAAGLAYKNEIAYHKLARRYHPGAVYYSPGLGILGSFWRSMGGSPLEPIPGRPGWAWRALRLASAAVAPLRSRPGITIVRAPDGAGPQCSFAFLGGVRRLRLEDRCRVRPLETPALRGLWGLPAASPGSGLYSRLLGRTIRQAVGSGPWELCTTIHAYQPRFSDIADALGLDLKIFIDGYHPSNYPRSYLDAFLSGTFVVANVASADWFRRHGRRACPPHAFQSSELFSDCRCDRLRTVVLLMNHAGDWTSVINRSDSDLLIEAFAELARRHPRLTFWIRLHPTMAHPAHEGTRSIGRIHRYVDQLALPNLAISGVALEEDLVRGDLFLSEYSQVLIDAWQRGRLGLAVNLTGRRSFMQDFERLGFLGCSGFDALSEAFSALPSALPDLVARQNRAVQRFNRLQRTWEGRTGRQAGGRT
jgi:hypothetical protein